VTRPAPLSQHDYIPHARAERLIAAGRFVLAASSLVAVYLEPSTPARYQRPTYGLLLIYTLYALALVVVASRSAIAPARWRVVSHALDLVLFSIFVYLTEGPASPFFLYFVFSLFCATLRFSWRGILATGLSAMAIYGTMAAVAAMRDPEFEASRVLIREAYLGVIAALLVYLGVYHQRSRRELASLAAWPRELKGNLEAVLRATLAHAAYVVSARRVVLLWEDSEEPWIHSAASSTEKFALERVPHSAYAALTGHAFRNTSFFIRSEKEPVLVYDGGHSAMRDMATDALGTNLRARYAIASAIVVSLESESLLAHLVIPDVRAATADDLALAHIAGRLTLATLEQFLYVQQVRHTASAEERLRISRELHDGIVQSLGGVGLQLEGLRSQLAVDAATAERFTHVQRIIEHDQRELRAIVRELRPHDDRAGRDILADELRRMRERFALEWGLEVRISDADHPDVPPRLAHELCRILNESLSNAAKHGASTRAEIDVSVNDSTVQVRVADNGRGFPFTGRYGLSELERSGSGPRTLKERIALLQGSLWVDSSPRGAVIDVVIPIAGEWLA
jgi:signal transduction histidine kinase